MQNSQQFPYLWYKEEPSSMPLPQLIEQQEQKVKAILAEAGAILFRGFKIDNAKSLTACSEVLPGNAIGYSGGNSPRTNIQGNVYTSTEHPAEAHISLHNELSYASQWPSHILFCCHTPALEGGQTPIADSRKILRSLSVEVQQAFREKGIQYIRNLHGGYGPGPSWQNTFETNDQHLVEAYCSANDVAFEWEGTDNLRLIEKRPAIITHPLTGEEVWFNQADQFHPSTNSPEVYQALIEIYQENLFAMPQFACFGDGLPIPDWMLEHIREVFEQHTTIFTWEKGDLLLLDNILVAHGRTPFRGPRKILVSMVAGQN